MLAQQNKYTNVSGTFPNALMIDASGAGLTDGSEFAALPLNDGWEPFSQAVMSYASGVQLQNIPTGSVGVPNGVSDSVGLSQVFEALQRSIGNGPGNYTLWGNELDPSVTGDRVLLLAEQGVLIATYPALDAANWIGGDTAAQIAAEAAGQKFYRSSDAGGATGNAAGPYLQLPPQNPTFLKQYLGDGTDFTVTEANWTTNRAAGVYYLTSDGAHRLILDIGGVFASGTVNIKQLTISGITFKNVAGHNQPVNLCDQELQGRAADQFTAAYAILNNNIINILASSAIDFSSGSGLWSLSGNFELDSKPTWADDFIYQWGIRY